MSREARKANLRKLQLPGTGSSDRNLRRTRSAAAAVTTTISTFFSATPEVHTPQQPDEQPQSSRKQQPAEENTNTAAEALKPSTSNTATHAKRTKLVAFLFKDSKNIPAHLRNGSTQSPSDDFETPQKKIKKAPTLRRTNATKTSKSRANNRQPSVKSAFLRNELLFSEITAQHSAAEHFNPDEVQLALALSKSEVESNAALCGAGAVEKEVVVDLVGGANCSTEGGHQTTENVRDKLQMYGFRTAAREDYKCLAAVFLPGVNRRTKCKWANKFTALTMRNPEIQRKKIDTRIEDFLKLQLRTRPLSAAENRMEPYVFISKLLQQCRDQQQAEHVLKREDETLLTLPLAEYFVQELVEVSHVPAGHLLKDWSAIPGRDLSPKQRSKKSIMKEAKLQAAYAELEAYFSGLHGNLGLEEDDVGVRETDSVVAGWESKVELEKMVELIAELPQSPQNLALISGDEPTELQSNIADAIAITASPTKEPPEKKAKMPSNSEIEFSDNTTLRTPQCSTMTQSSRLTSPDIFADSDKESDEAIDVGKSATGKDDTTDLDKSATVEDDATQLGKPATVEDEVMENCSVFSEHGIAIYESYCSEEVKTCFNNGHCESVLNQGIEINPEDAEEIVDLTQDEEEIAEEALESHSSTITDRVDTVLDHNSAGIIAENPYQGSVERNLSQDPEIAAALKDFGRAEPSLESSKSPNSCEITDEQFSRLLEKYMKPDKSLQLNEPPARNVARKRLSKERSWNCATPAVQTEKVTCLKRRKSTLFTSNVDQFDTAECDTSEDFGIDLTQSDVSDSTDSCIVLSDDEINYSIWRAAKNTSVKLGEKKSPVGCSSSEAEAEESGAHDFSILNLIDEDELSSNSTAQQGRSKQLLSPEAQSMSLFHASPNSVEGEYTVGKYLTTRSNSNDCIKMPRTSKAHDRSRELAEFGILENFSEPFTQISLSLQTPSKSAADCFGPRANDDSFLGSPSENAAFMRRCRSSSSQKFSELLQEVPTTTDRVNGVAASITNEDVFDEFDKLVYGSPKRTPTPKRQRVPVGLEQLLTAEISFRNERKREISKSGEEEGQGGATAFTSPLRHEYDIDGRKYKARVVVTPKPDFMQQTEAELLKQLYGFGIKPLKRKQAVKMLEYIYNQTHPIMLEDAPSQSSQMEVVASVRAMEVSRQAQSQSQQLSGIQATAAGTAASQTELQLQDCGGEVLLRFAHELSIEREDEQYIFQTNISKKVSQALLPLHVAWYNLVCSSSTLHEMILLFEPIDLQQIYLFFKKLGFRYEPKDLKRFFDSRCIIFRYDLTSPGQQAGRHTRKTIRRKKTVGNKLQKCR